MRLKEPYRTWGWSSFAENEDSQYGSLECPNCNVPYGGGSGELTVREDEFTCKPCNKTWKLKMHYTNHMQKHHGVD
jgi:transposase-like protein